jgi:cell division protein FtsL
LLFEEALKDDDIVDSYGYSSEDIDITPSATTMQFTLENDDCDDGLQNAQKSYGISARGKIMIAVYTLVVATIIALIAMNAKVLKTMEESIKEKEAAVGSLIQQTQLLSEELAHVSSEDVISQKAIELGMTR